MLTCKNHILRPVFLTLAILFLFPVIQAAAHVEKGNMPDSVAEMEYRILLEFKPNNFDVRNKLGMVLFRAEKFADAAREFNYVLKKEPENVDALTGLGRVNTKTNNLQEALTFLQKAIALNPDGLHNYYYLGQAMETQGDMTGAEDAYRKGLDREVSSQVEHYEQDRKLLTEALQNLQKRQKNTPGSN